MRRSFIYSIVACIALCAVSVVRVVELAVERAVNWALNVLDVRAPTFDLGGELVSASGPAIFRDPHVERHEAGMSRRAAARAI